MANCYSTIYAIFSALLLGRHFSSHCHQLHQVLPGHVVLDSHYCHEPFLLVQLVLPAQADLGDLYSSYQVLLAQKFGTAQLVHFHHLHQVLFFPSLGRMSSTASYNSAEPDYQRELLIMSLVDKALKEERKDLTQYIDDALREEQQNLHIYLKEERQHLHSNLHKVVTGFSEPIQAAFEAKASTESIQAEHTKLHLKIAQLEERNDEKIIAIENGVGFLVKFVENLSSDLSQKICNVDLKTETYSSYHEHLLYNLKQGLYDVLSSIKPLKSTRELHLQLEPFEVLTGHAPYHHHVLPAQPLPANLVHSVHDHMPHNVFLPPVPPAHAVHFLHNQYNPDVPVNTGVEMFKPGDTIPQGDGNDTLEGFEFSDVSPTHSPITTSASLAQYPQKTTSQHDSPASFLPTSSVNTASLQAPYALNQLKQVAGLVKHANLSDFEVEVNDSNTNINIQCSSGFYQSVAKSAFSNLSEGFQRQIFSITIRCIEIRNTLDMGSNIPGQLLKFDLKGAGVTPEPARVSVHLHHTQQKVQIQGGARMPDQTTAPVWFLENLLKERFVSLAKHRKYDIKEINRKIGTLKAHSGLQKSSAKVGTCPHCKKSFKSNSKPAMCGNCCSYFHNTKQNKCFVSHVCLPIANQQPYPSTTFFVPNKSLTTSLQSPSPAAASSRTPAITTTEANNSPHTSSSVLTLSPGTATSCSPYNPHGSTSTFPPTHKRPRLEIPNKDRIVAPDGTGQSVFSSSGSNCTFSSTSSGSLSSTLNPGPRTSLPPSSGPAPPSPISSASAPSAPPSSLDPKAPTFTPQPRQNNKRKSKAPALTPESAKIESLGIELNAAKTRIVELDTELEDNEIKIKLLREKIRILEMNQQDQAFNKYFPNEQNISSSFAGRSHTTPPSQPPPSQTSCCHSSCLQAQRVPPCCHFQRQPPPPAQYNGDIAELRNSLAAVKVDIVKIVSNIEDIRQSLATKPTSNQSREVPEDVQALLTKTPITSQSSSDAHEVPDDDPKLNERISLDESVASNEEFIPDMPDSNPPISLN